MSDDYVLFRCANRAFIEWVEREGVKLFQRTVEERGGAAFWRQVQTGYVQGLGVENDTTLWVPGWIQMLLDTTLALWVVVTFVRLVQRKLLPVEALEATFALGGPDAVLLLALMSNEDRYQLDLEWHAFEREAEHRFQDARMRALGA